MVFGQILYLFSSLAGNLVFNAVVGFVFICTHVLYAVDSDMHTIGRISFRVFIYFKL